MTAPVELLLSEYGEASSRNLHREASGRRTLNADIAGVQEFPIERWRIDVFFVGGGVGVLNTDPEEFCECLGGTFFDILPEVDGER